MNRLYRLYSKWRAWRMLDDILKRRTRVEQRLFDAACGKKPLPDADECRELARKLGTPSGRP